MIVQLTLQWSTNLHLLPYNQGLHYGSRDPLRARTGSDHGFDFMVSPSLHLSPDSRPEQVNRLLSADRKCSRLRWIRPGRGRTVSWEIDKHFVIIWLQNLNYEFLKDTNVTNQRYFIFLKIETEQEGRHEGFVGSVFFFLQINLWTS